MSSSYLLDAEAVGCDEVWSTAYINDKVWTGGLDGQLRCYDTSKSKESASASSSSTSARSLGIVSLDATESFVVTNQLHSQLTRWALDDEGTTIRKQASTSQLASGHNAAWSLSLHPSEEIVATAGAGARLKMLRASVQGFGEIVHEASEGAMGNTGSSKADFASCCRMSPDGNLVAVSTTTGQVFLSDASTGHLLQSFPAHSKNIRALSFSSDSGLLITGSDDKRINIFDIRGASRRQSGGNVASLEGHPGWVLSLAVRSDGKTLASGSSDGAIKLWDLSQTSGAFATLQSEKDIWSLSWKAHASPVAGFEGIGGSGVGGGQFVAGASTGLQWWRSTS